MEFARQGADVVLHYSHASDGADSGAREIQKMGRHAAICAADFKLDGAGVELADFAINFLGGLECLVNNAGITFNSPFLKMKPEHVGRHP